MSREATAQPEPRERSLGVVDRTAPQASSAWILAIFVRALAAAILAYVVINFVLIPGNGVIGFPIQHDDFNNLSHTSIDLHHAHVRPVSTIVLMALSIAGPTAYFLTLHLLTVVYVALVTTFLALLFSLRRPPLALLVALSLPAFSFEYIVYYYRYTGLITSQLSVTLGSLALLLLLVGLRDSLRPGAWVASGIVAFALSALAKEDFILPVLVLCAFLALPGVVPSRGRRRAALALVLVLGAAAAAWLLYSTLVMRSAFLGTAGGTYERVVTPASLLTTVYWYLKVTLAARCGAALQALGLVAGLLLGRKRYWREVALAQVIPLTLILAYAPLPHHTSPYYCFNWLPWQAGCLIALGPMIVRLPRRLARAGVLVALLTLAAIPVAITQPQRRGLTDRYQAGISISRNVIGTLLADRAAIAGSPRVAILDPPAYNPWFGTDGSFLANRYGLDHCWLVLVPRSGEYYQATLGLGGRFEVGRVRTADPSELERFPRMPAIRFGPDGRGTLSWTEPGPRAGSGESSLWAEPNPIRVCDGSPFGVTTVAWRVLFGTPVEVRVGSPTGTVFARGYNSKGAFTTGKWILDGTTFLLVEATSRETLATVTVHLTTAGCR